MTSKMNEIFRKILKDRDIFDSPYDKNAKGLIPKLFEGDEWKELKKLFEENRQDDFNNKVDARIREIKNQESGGRGLRHGRINELKQRAEWLKSAFENKPHLLAQLFENLEWYGLVECKLPNMDKYGKVIERHELSIVEQFFTDKIKSSSFHQSKALSRVLEYIKELYKSGISVEEIAYFVRKLNSLEKYWEVLE